VLPSLCLFALHGEFDGEEMLTLQPPCFVVRAGTVGVLLGQDSRCSDHDRIARVPATPASLGQLARRYDTHAALFTLAEFLLDILPCGGSQVVSLTETPKKRHNTHQALRLNPGGLFAGSGVGPSRCYSTG